LNILYYYILQLITIQYTMEWSFNQNRMLSMIELNERPDRHKKSYYRYLCCFTRKKYV